MRINQHFNKDRDPDGRRELMLDFLRQPYAQEARPCLGCHTLCAAHGSPVGCRGLADDMRGIPTNSLATSFARSMKLACLISTDKSSSRLPSLRKFGLCAHFVF